MSINYPSTGLCFRLGRSVRRVSGLETVPRLLYTGGVSYSVGGAAVPPTLSSATPTVWLATSIFNGF